MIALAVAITLAAAGHTRRVRAAIIEADPEKILNTPEIADDALALGRKGFVAHCASCHRDGAGNPARGVPDLTDQDFLYGSGRVAEIEQIVLHGIRSGDPRGWHLASMPAYARARPYASEPIPPLTPHEIRDVTQYLLRKHGSETDPAAAERGAQVYGTNGGCWDCHERDGGGDTSIGAPNLLDDIWLYGDGSTASIQRSIAYGHEGSSPAFARIVSPADARAIAVYVAALAKHRTRIDR